MTLWISRRKTFHLECKIVMMVDRDLINLKAVKAILSTTAIPTLEADRQNTLQVSNNKIIMIKELKNSKIYLAWAILWSKMEILKKWRLKGIKISSIILYLCQLGKLRRPPQCNSLWHQFNSQLQPQSNRKWLPQSNSQLLLQWSPQLQWWPPRSQPLTSSASILLLASRLPTPNLTLSKTRSQA